MFDSFICIICLSLALVVLMVWFWFVGLICLVGLFWFACLIISVGLLCMCFIGLLCLTFVVSFADFGCVPALFVGFDGLRV